MRNTREMLELAVALLEDMESALFGGSSVSGIAERYDAFMEEYNG